MAFSEFQRERILELGRKGNVTPNQIAARIGGTPDSIRQLLRRNGIEPVTERAARGFDYKLKRDLVQDRLTRGKRKRKPSRRRNGG